MQKYKVIKKFSSILSFFLPSLYFSKACSPLHLLAVLSSALPTTIQRWWLLRPGATLLPLHHLLLKHSLFQWCCFDILLVWKILSIYKCCVSFLLTKKFCDIVQKSSIWSTTAGGKKPNLRIKPKPVRAYRHYRGREDSSLKWKMKFAIASALNKTSQFHQVRFMNSVKTVHRREVFNAPFHFKGQLPLLLQLLQFLTVIDSFTLVFGDFFFFL